jgi:HK97 family phage major capsid protein
MSITRAQQLRREKKELSQKFVDLGKKIDAEKRLMTSEEREEVDRIDADIKAFDLDIERFEKIEAREMEALNAPREKPLAGAEDSRRTAAEGEVEGDDPPSAETASLKKRTKAYAAAFGSYLRRGESKMAAGDLATLQSGRHNVKLADLPEDVRDIVYSAMGAGTDVLGGFIIPPEPARGIIEAMKAYGGMRKSRAEVITTSHGREIPWITNDDTSNAATIIGEARPASEAADIVFGTRSLSAYIYTTGYIKVSFTLSQDTEFNLEGMINERFAERMGRGTERDFAIGNGSSRPEGIAVSAQLGRTGPAGQTASVKSADFTNLFHSIDPAYRENAEWMMHDTSLLAAKLLVDTQGRPLWRSGLATREPDMIEGKPYIINQSLPAMGTSAKSIFFGDFRYYKIRDVMPPMAVRLTERFIEFGQVAYLMFGRHDGKLIHGANAADLVTLCPIKYYQNAAS